MAFLRNKTIIITIVVIIVIALFVHFSGILYPESLGLVITASPLNGSIVMGQNTTMTVIIENQATQTQTFEFHIVYASENLTYYNGITNEPLPDPLYSGKNYTIIYPKDILGPNEEAKYPVIVKGFLPIGASSKRFTIFLEVYTVDDASKVLSNRISTSLTVTQT